MTHTTVSAPGRPPPPEPDSKTRSPVLRRILLSATGVAWTVLVALGVELLGTPWSGSTPLRAAGWVLFVVVLLVLAGWWATTAAERARVANVRRLSRPIPGPPAPLRANWSPGPEPLLPENARLAVERVVEELQKNSAVIITGAASAEPMAVIRAAAQRVIMIHEHRAAYRDLHVHVPADDSPAYTAASLVLPAFGMVAPDSSPMALERAARRLIEELRTDPTLVVLDNVRRADAIEWLLRPWPSDGSSPWLLVAGFDLASWPELPVPVVDLGGAPAPPDREPTVAANFSEFHPEARVLARTLAELPEGEFGAEAIAAVHAEVSPNATRPLLELLDELAWHGVVDCSPDTARYRLRSHQRDEALQIDWPYPTASRWPAALPALLQHYADLCDQWVTALRTVANAEKATQWFRTEEPMLYSLIKCASPTEHRMVVDQLTRIADALDVWYARQRQPERALQVANAYYAFADAAGYPIHRALAETRQRAAYRRGARGIPSEYRDLPKHRLRAAMYARQLHELGLEELDLALRPDPESLERADGEVRARPNHDLLSRAEASLKEAWVSLPRSDVAGAIAVAIDLAVVHLHQGRLDAARDRLAVAEDLTLRDFDLAGQAHVHELMGIVAWSGGDRYGAVDRWLNAFGLACKLADERTESRCLQHLATAVLAEPGLARLALPVPDDPDADAFDETYALLNARSWLERSLKLRPGQPDDCLAVRYLRMIDSRLAPRREAGRIRPPRIPEEEREQSRLERLGARVAGLIRWSSDDS